MFHINDLFKKFHAAIHSKDELKETIISVITEIIGYGIDPQNIRVYGDTVYVRENPVLKNEIFFKKKEILDMITVRVGKKILKDIR